MKRRDYDWDLVKTLHIGGQSQIWQAVDKNDPKSIYIGKQALKPEYAEGIRREHRILKTIVKSGFQHAVDEGETTDKLYISYRRYCDGITLDEKLAERGGSPRFFMTEDGSEDDFLEFAFRLTHLVHYLHVDHRIVHRDIKPKNVLFGNYTTISLIDLGIAREIGEAGDGEYSQGWASDEQKIAGRPAHPSHDMYALGRLFLWCLKIEHKKRNGEFIAMAGFEVPQWLMRNKIAQDFIDMCIDCVQQPELKRPTVEDMMKVLRRAVSAGNRKQRINDVCPDCGHPTAPGNPMCYQCLAPLLYEPPSGVCGVCSREIQLTKMRRHYEQAHPEYSMSRDQNSSRRQKVVFECPFCHWATSDERSWIAHQRFCTSNDPLLDQMDVKLVNHSNLVKVPYAHDNPRALLALSQAGFRFENLEVYRSLNIKTYDHQEDTVIRALRDLGGRCIIADGVGLGKTVECGIILRELLYRELVHSVLIIVPNLELQGQWIAELEDKFELGPDDPNGFKPWIATHDGPPEPGNRLVIDVRSLNSTKISSATQSKVKANYVQNLGLPEVKGIDDLTLDNLFINNYIRWDLVIVDEAHDLGINYQGKRWKSVYMLDPHFLFLVTATPMRRSPSDLYPLIRAINPVLAGDQQAFRIEYGTGSNSIQTLHKLKSLLSQVMIRHTRNDVHSFSFPRRKAITHFAGLQGPFQALYDAIKKINLAGIKESSEINDKLQSAAHNIFKLFNRSIVDFANGISDIDEETGVAIKEIHALMEMTHPATPTGAYLRARWKDIIKECQAINMWSYAQDPKIISLFSVLRKYWGQGMIDEGDHALNDIDREGKSPVIVFAGTNTMRDQYRKILLTTFGKEKVIEGFKDGMKRDERLDLLKRFNNGKIDVLVCGNSQSRGLNLQYGNILINMDLPSSPVEIEQRIGRVERLEQKKSLVYIINIMYDIEEERFRWEMYSKHLMMFQEVLGDIDLVNLFVATEIVETVENLNKAIVQGIKTHYQIEKDFDELNMKIKRTRELQESVLYKESDDESF